MTPTERKVYGFYAVVLLVVAIVCLWRQIPPRVDTWWGPMQTGCLSNVKQIAIGTLIYRQDTDDVLPPADWTAALLPKLGTVDMFHCPMYAHRKGGPFAMNARLVRQRAWGILERKAVLYFEFDGTSASPIANIRKRARTRHRDRSSIAYLDGHAKVLKADEEP